MFLVVLALLASADPPAPSPLARRLAPLIAAHKGTVAVGVKNLATGEVFYHNPDRVMPTASLVKVAVMIEAYLRADEGKISLFDRVTLRDEDKVPGSGILTQHFTSGATFTLRDAVRLMIAISDNTATNIVLERVGIAAVNARMKALGYPETRINAKVWRGSTTSVDPARTKQYGLGSTTAKEMVALFERLEKGDGLRPAIKQAMLTHLKANDDTEKFGGLKPGVVVAHKDGAVERARTDAGIFYFTSGPVVVCVLTADNEDRRWAKDNAGNVLCAKVAREVRDHFAPPAKAK